MIPAAAFAALWMAQAAPAPFLTHDFGVVRADLLVKEMAARTGWPMKASPSLSSDFIYFNVRGMTFEEARTALGLVCEAKWTVKDGEHHLSQGSSAVQDPLSVGRAFIEEYFAGQPISDAPLTEAEIRSTLEVWKKASEQMDMERQSIPLDLLKQVHRLSPATKAADRIARSLGKGFFLNLKPGDRVVLSPQPTRRQMFLPLAGQRAVASLLQESALVEKVMGENSDPAGAEASASDISPKSRLRPGPYDVVIQSQGMSPSVTVRIATEDLSQWHTQEYGTLMTESLMGLASNPTEQSVPPPFAGIRGLLPLSKEAADISASLSGWGESLGGQRKVHPLILDALLKPGKRDFLDIAMDEKLDLLAAKLEKGLVTPVSDLAPLIPSMGLPTYVDVAQSISIAPGFMSAGRVETLGTNFVHVPAQLQQMRAMRADRRAAASLLADLLSSKAMLDVMADWVVSGEDSWTKDLVNSILLGSSFRSAMELVGPELSLVRLYSQLPLPQRERVKSGGMVFDIASLAPSALAEVERIIYGREDSLIPRGSTPVAGVIPEYEKAANPFGNQPEFSMVQNYSMEPTRRLGQGIPVGSQIRVSAPSRTSWFMSERASRDVMLPRPFSASEIAYSHLTPSTPDYRVQPITHFFAGRSTLLQGELLLSNGDLSQVRLLFHEPAAQGRALTQDELPNPLRQAIAAAMEEVRGQMGGDTGGGVVANPPSLRR
jgi:hypothetical protein